MGIFEYLTRKIEKSDCVFKYMNSIFIFQSKYYLEWVYRFHM